jgi:outer membrane lipoprotein LolB
MRSTVDRVDSLVQSAVFYPLRCLLLLALLSASACAVRFPIMIGEEKAPPATGGCRVCVVDVWTLDGRVAVQTAQDGWSANLHWEHDRAQDRVRISGPFSQGAVSVVLQGDLIYINEGNGKTEVSRDPDTALRERVGFPVPLRSLRYWLLGVPAQHTDTAAVTTGEGFVQQGWTLNYSGAYQADGFTLPARMVANNEHAKLKLVVDSWGVGK